MLFLLETRLEIILYAATAFGTQVKYNDYEVDL